MNAYDFVSKSLVSGKRGCVSSDLPMASTIGKKILEQGGNAADAVIAMAAAVSVGLPLLCGIGGDCNCLYYNASTKKVLAVNGTGRSANALTLQKVKDAGLTADSVVDSSHGLLVNVPGCVAGWFSCLEYFGSGKLSMAELLVPATKLAKFGITICPKAASVWEKNFSAIRNSPNHSDFLVDGHTPKAGDVFCNPKLADCFMLLSDNGPSEFYDGAIAEKIVEEVKKSGGALSIDDMKHHLQSSISALPSKPICVEISGFELWEMTPNTIGIVALVALNLLKGYNLKDLRHNSAAYIHLVAEALYISYSDCWQYLCDPELSSSSYNHLLTEEYAVERRKHIRTDRHQKVDHLKETLRGSDTSYVTAVDKEGNACSFIFSVSSYFGSGIIPDDSGFVLHDRGKCFSFNEKSPNCFGPRKQSLHTIIPAIITDASTKEVIATMGVVGRWMQPQGHVQVLLNMLVFGMNPQEALDMPRFGVGNNSEYTGFIDSTETLFVEIGIPDEVCSSLKERGHSVMQSKTPLGRGHVIAKQKLWSEISSDVWFAGCDGRNDAVALGL